MSPSTPALSLVLHTWGDPGALDRDRDRAWDAIQGPLLAILRELPRLRVGLVLGGELIPHWEEKHPERIELVRELTRQGRVELVATPMYEPVLSAIPERDAVAQLARHTVTVKRVFGVRPTGSWLPHRIWDPALPRVFERADLDWVLVDDLAVLRHHPGRPDPWGVWWTERGGHAVRLFAADARVVEMLGTVPVSDLLLYARGRAVQGAEVQFWGLSTHDPQLGRAWLDEFLRAVAASTHLALVPPSEAAKLVAERGRTYLPSHAPGMEHHRASFEGEHPWERHLLDHPAADRLHKKMLRVSRQLARWRSDVSGGELRPDPDAEVQAERYLLRSQSADAYRPGDRPETRWRAWRDLVRAERFVLGGRRALDRPVAELADVGIRGRPQVVLRTAAGGAVIDPDRGAGVVELCFFDVSANVVDPISAPQDAVPAAFVEALHLDLAGRAKDPAWVLQNVERDDDGTARCAFAGEASLGPYTLQLVKSFVLRPHAAGAGAPYGTSRFDWVLDLTNPGQEPIRGKVTLSVPLMVGPSLDGLDVSTIASRKETPSPGPRNASWRATETRRSTNEIADLEVAVQATFAGPAAELEALLRSVGSLRFGLRRPARTTSSPVRTVGADGVAVDQGLLLTFEWTIELVARERDRLGLSLEVGA